MKSLFPRLTCSGVNVVVFDELKATVLVASSNSIALDGVANTKLATANEPKKRA